MKCRGHFDLDFGFSPLYKPKKKSKGYTVRKPTDSHLFFVIHTDHSESPYAVYFLCIWRWSGKHFFKAFPHIDIALWGQCDKIYCTAYWKKNISAIAPVSCFINSSWLLPSNSSWGKRLTSSHKSSSLNDWNKKYQRAVSIHIITDKQGSVFQSNVVQSYGYCVNCCPDCFLFCTFYGNRLCCSYIYSNACIYFFFSFCL